MALAGDLHLVWTTALQEGDGGNNPGSSLNLPYPHSGLDKKKQDELHRGHTHNSSLMEVS